MKEKKNKNIQQNIVQTDNVWPATDVYKNHVGCGTYPTTILDNLLNIDIT